MPATTKDLAIIKQLKNDFYQQSQWVIEKYYLKPLSKNNNGFGLEAKHKDNLKDGVLERSIHGGMHVGRAQFWVPILHQELKKILPDEVEKNLSLLSAQLGLNEDEIITLIRYAVLFHDSERQHEAQDEWDKESAQNAKAFFEAQGLSTELADIFSQAAALKDKPEAFGKLFPDYQYIRQLVYLADCFDIIRCNSRFRLEEALRAFGKDQHAALTPAFIEIAKQIHHLLSVQEDMLFPCVIILPDGEEIDLNDSKSHFSIAKKVKFEHADNVCSVMCESIKTHTRFAPYLVDELLLSSAYAQVTPAFNPYIHGTNSSIFSLLKRTSGKMVPTLHLLSKGIAPMTGEIEGLWGGGIASNLHAASPICFGRLDCTGDYNLEKIIRYAGTEYVPQNLAAISSSTRYYCDEYITNDLRRCFEKINGTLVYVGRAKQLGIEPFAQKSYETFKKEFNALLQLYYLYLLIGTHIHPGFHIAAIEESNEGLFDEIVSSFYAHLTYDKLIEKIIAQQLNIKDIYEHPTEEGLKKVLSLLEFPIEATIGTGIACHDVRVVTLGPEHRQMFSLSPPNWQAPKAYDYPHHYMQYLLANQSSESTHQFLLNSQMKKHKIDHEKFKKIVLYRIKKLEEKMALLDKIYTADNQSVKFTPREQSFLEKPFPIILVCAEKAEGKIHLCKFSEQEYRAYEPMQLGEDLDMIATDTVAHQQIIMTFLKENNIDNVQVVLIEQLQQSLRDHKKPDNMHPTTLILASPSAVNTPLPDLESSLHVVKNNF